MPWFKLVLVVSIASWMMGRFELARVSVAPVIAPADTVEGRERLQSMARRTSSGTLSHRCVHEVPVLMLLASVLLAVFKSF